MTRTNRYFEVFLNENFFAPAYTLENVTEKKAVRMAVAEAKANDNDTVQIIEVDSDGEIIENGFCSGTIVIKK